RATARSRVRSMRDLNGFLAQRRTGNFGAAPLVLGVGRCYSPNPAGGQRMVASTVVSQILTRWAHLYGRTPVSATLTYLHLVGILVGGGVAVAAAAIIPAGIRAPGAGSLTSKDTAITLSQEENRVCRTHMPLRSATPGRCCSPPLRSPGPPRIPPRATPRPSAPSCPNGRWS